jgi:hypothetical protein
MNNKYSSLYHLVCIRITVGWNFEGDAEINIIDGKNALFRESDLHFKIQC